MIHVNDRPGLHCNGPHIMKRAKMDLEKKLTDEELAHTKLSADVGALKAAVISLIEALPESRKAAVEANMKLFMNPRECRVLGYFLTARDVRS